jgi:hypothetical protein
VEGAGKSKAFNRMEALRTCRETARDSLLRTGSLSSATKEPPANNISSIASTQEAAKSKGL